MNKVLVTGGSGMVGNALKNTIPGATYVSSRDYNLVDSISCQQMFSTIKPDMVIHLAAQVGGIKENTTKQAEFYYNNTMINTNVLHCASKHGVKRVLSALSTCCYPNIVKEYPFTEADILSGPPAISNLSYGFSKRSLHIQSKAYRKQYGLNYSCFCPSNIYGPGDNFDDDSSHFVPALIKKVSSAKDGDTIELWGTGNPLRQQMYVEDLAEIIPILLKKHNSDIPILVTPDENLSIKEMANICSAVSGKNLSFEFNGKLEGQHRKDGSNAELLKLIGKFEFMSFRRGVDKTYEWYMKNE